MFNYFKSVNPSIKKINKQMLQIVFTLEKKRIYEKSGYNDECIYNVLCRKHPTITTYNVEC